MKANLSKIFFYYIINLRWRKHYFHVTNIFVVEEEDSNLQTLTFNTTLVSNNVVITWNIVNM